MLLVLLVGSVALQAWAWRRLRSRVAASEVTRLGASVRYAGWALAPLLLFVALFFGFVGLEELSGKAIISELMGRAALPVATLLLGIAGLGWVCFSISCALIGRVRAGKS
jgi:hypothetical protein